MLLILIKILFVLLPIALVTGPFFPDFIISVLGLFFIYESLSKRLFHYYKHPFVYLFTFFYLYILFRSFTSVDILLSLESSLFYFRYLFFALSVALIIDYDKRIVHYFSISLIIILLIVSIDAYIQYLTGTNFLGMMKEKDGRISGLFGDEYILGSYISRLLPIGFFYLAYLKNLKSWMMYLAMFFLISSDILIYLAAERTAFFYLILSTLLIILLTRRFKTIRIITFLFSILIIIFLNLFFSDVRNRMINHTFTQLGFNNDSNEIYIFSTEHQQHFTSAFRMFKDKPIFGNGPKLFRLLCNEEEYKIYELQSKTGSLGCSTHPHNTYVQLLAETGLVGTIPIFLLFIYVSIVLIRQVVFIYFMPNKIMPLSDGKICLYIAMFISLWPFVPTGSFFGNWLGVIYFLPIGFLLSKKLN